MRRPYVRRPVEPNKRSLKAAATKPEASVGATFRSRNDQARSVGRRDLQVALAPTVSVGADIWTLQRPRPRSGRHLRSHADRLCENPSGCSSVEGARGVRSCEKKSICTPRKSSLVYYICSHSCVQTPFSNRFVRSLNGLC